MNTTELSTLSTDDPKVRLTPSEQDALRRLGGTGYMGIVEFLPGLRGGRIRPVRTTIYRTQSGAQAELDRHRFRNPEARREVVTLTSH